MSVHRLRESDVHVETALVECLMLAVSDLDGLDGIPQALVDLARRDVIRILDVVCLARGADDARVTVREMEEAVSPELLPGVGDEVRRMLSDRDISSAALLVEPGGSAILLLVEDRWAEGLARACRVAGGRIVGGERIAPSLVESVMTPAEVTQCEPTALSRERSSQRRKRHAAAPARAANADLLTVFPHTDPCQNDRWIDLIVDPADRLAEVTELFERGMITLDQLEAQKDRIFGTAGRQRP